MFNKLGAILSGKYKKIRGIDDKLGLVEFKIEDVNLSKIPEVKLPQKYKTWYPGKHERLAEIEREVNEKKEPRVYVKKPIY
jgi:hypothetical protein